MPLACPSCGSKNLRFSQRKSVWDTFLALVGFYSVRCRDCSLRYREGFMGVPSIGYANCPKCFRQDLTDWEEKYYYPPRWQQALLHIGAKAHRCAVCRLNFVSFRRRKSEFVPSWKQKQQAGGQGGTRTGSAQKEKERTVA